VYDTRLEAQMYETVLTPLSNKFRFDDTVPYMTEVLHG